LHALLDWVNTYKECGSREQMEKEGYDFPPIEPDFSPDDDWFLFERWMQGKPLRQSIIKQLPKTFTPKEPAKLTDQQIAEELDTLIELLSDIHICVDNVKDIPPRLMYTYIIEQMDEEYSILSGGQWHLDGCTGYCPDCFQRPWCDFGSRSCWPEDEKAGEMVLIDSVRQYVSPSPMSLSVLRKLQAEDDAKSKDSDSDDDLIDGWNDFKADWDDDF
jgi:hypothetical protein